MGYIIGLIALYLLAILGKKSETVEMIMFSCAFIFFFYSIYLVFFSDEPAFALIMLGYCVFYFVIHFCLGAKEDEKRDQKKRDEKATEEWEAGEKEREYKKRQRDIQREREEQVIRDAERQKRETEIKAMNLVMDYERGEGRKPDDISAENLGYDIKSLSSTETRMIEVKGLYSSHSESSYILLTGNEKEKAKELANSYFLYVVSNCLSHYPELIIVQNPDYKLSMHQEKDTNKYKICLKDILYHRI